jgi:ornithine decarboxylase
VLRLLAELGTGFDCASKAEIEMVLDLGVDPSRIIYAQPCKTKSYVRYAAEKGVKQMTFDNTDELYKIKRFFPTAELYLRILTDDSSSLCRLSDKYGASMNTTRDLLLLAKDLDLNVVGVSFHVGSGASDPQSFARAVADSRIVFDQAYDIGYNLKTLDVGGGFSGDSGNLFETMADVLSKALDEHFPPSVRIIGEPGRYYVASAFTLACNIIARRDIVDPATGETNYMIYLNDGVYGNFSNLIFDHQFVTPRVLSKRDTSTRSVDYSVWGQSCDGIDRITEMCTLHGVLDVGDWLYFEEMGAYTKCSATRFNGFTDNHDILYVSSEPGASALLNY